MSTYRQEWDCCGMVTETDCEVLDKCPRCHDNQERKNAERYLWLREQYWFSGTLCVLRNPKRVLTSGPALGADCPSRDRLDTFIDAEMSANA